MQKVSLIIESVGSRVITAQEEIFDYVESKSNVDETIAEFVQEKKLIDASNQKAQRELRRIIDQYFINEVSMMYEHIQKKVESLNVDTNTSVETELYLEIPDEDDLQKMLEGNFDYDDYLNDWVLNIENKSQNITTNQLINYYQRDPEKAWSNVNDLDSIIEEVQESEY